MDGFNENSNEQVQEQQPMGCLHRFSKTIKVVIIGVLIHSPDDTDVHD